MTKRLDVLEQDGWPARTILLGSADTLGDVVNHVRNTVAHRRLQFCGKAVDEPSYRADEAVDGETYGERGGETNGQRHYELGAPVDSDEMIYNFALPIRRFPFKLWWHLNGLNAFNFEHLTLLYFR